MRHNAKFLWFVILILCSCSSIRNQQGIPKDEFITQATVYLNEFRENCNAFGDKLWNRSLCVPMIVIDRSNLMAVATDLDPDGKFVKKNGMYIGTYVGNPIYANTSFKWGSRQWSMVLWPLSTDKTNRTRLLFHEAFHSIQDELKLPMANLVNNHLDSENGRTLIRLEWNAIMSALTNESSRRQDVINALRLRGMRFQKYPKAFLTETSLEIGEGLAEYTGVRLQGSANQETYLYLKGRLAKVPEVFSIVRSSAYYSGPLYGLLLDTTSSQWREKLSIKKDIGLLVAEAFGVSQKEIKKTVNSDDLKRYDELSIKSFEIERSKKIKAKIQKYMGEIDSPGKVEILLQSPQAMFNPYGILSVDDNRTIYETYELTDVWGKLLVTDGALIKNKNDKFIVTVSPPSKMNDNAAESTSWQLKLNSGWRFKKSEDSWVITKE